MLSTFQYKEEIVAINPRDKCYIDIPTNEGDFVDINKRLRLKFSTPRQYLEVPINIIRTEENKYISLKPRQRIEQAPEKKQIQ